MKRFLRQTLTRLERLINIVFAPENPTAHLLTVIINVSLDHSAIRWIIGAARIGFKIILRINYTVQMKNTDENMK